MLRNNSLWTISRTSVRTPNPPGTPTPSGDPKPGGPPKPSGDPKPAGDPPTVAPVLDGLAASPARFRAARSGGILATTTKRGTGTRLTWSASSASMTTFEVLAARPGRKAAGSCVAPRPRRTVPKARRCTRWVALGSTVHEDLQGRNAIRLTGRVNGRRLAPGAYRLEATPSLDDAEGRTVRIGFSIR